MKPNIDETKASGCNNCTVDDEITVLNPIFMAYIGLLQKYDIDDKSTIG